MIKIEDMLEAYYLCRSTKRTTQSAVEFEMNYEERIARLTRQINSRAYRPGKSICFVVTRPRYREVFAAEFTDRIGHQYIAMRLEPIMERIFGDRTFNCRKGKGQLCGINMLKNDILTCSNNYTEDCYVMKIDLKGFFMSIHKPMLADMIDDFVLKCYDGDDKDDLRFLCRLYIMHRPEENCERHSPEQLWTHIPKNKSLFTNDRDRGVAIGNLFAQLFANFLMNKIDWFIDQYIPLHGRYVDDIYCVDKDKNKLLELIPKIRSKLKELNLQLNEKKFYIQHYSKGVTFIGSVVKPYRIYTVKHCVYNFEQSVKKLNKSKNVSQIAQNISSVNSYLGILKHTASYNIRRRVLSKIEKWLWAYLYIRGRFEVLCLKKKYRAYDIIKNQILKGYETGNIHK